jgi:hypothetical protein
LIAPGNCLQCSHNQGGAGRNRGGEGIRSGADQNAARNCNKD